MYGAIIGDIVGSRFEFNNCKSKDFEFFSPYCYFTDDTVMTCAIAAALLSYKNTSNANLSQAATYWMQKLGRKYVDAGYGGNFYQWIQSEKPEPYNSFGNGSAMRVSPCAWTDSYLAKVINNAEQVTSVTHNHPEGIKGANAIATAIYLAKEKQPKSLIYNWMSEYYNLDFTLDEIRDTYTFDETCQNTVPQAIKCFLESDSFEDCIRNAISIGGDSDTIAAMAGSIAEGYYGIPPEMIDKARTYLDKYLLQIIDKFQNTFILKTT